MSENTLSARFRTMGHGKIFALMGAALLALTLSLVPTQTAQAAGTVHVFGYGCQPSGSSPYAVFWGSTDGARPNVSVTAYYSVNNGAWHRISNVSTGKYGIGATGTITSSWPKGSGSVGVRVKIDGEIGYKSLTFASGSRGCRDGGRKF